jgi:hypothetical protein
VERDLCHGKRECEQAAFDLNFGTEDANFNVRRNCIAELSVGVGARFTERNGDSGRQESVDYHFI